MHSRPSHTMRAAVLANAIMLGVMSGISSPRVGKVQGDSAPTPEPTTFERTGRGGGKRTHRVSGAAAHKRAARKRRNIAKHNRSAHR